MKYVDILRKAPLVSYLVLPVYQWITGQWRREPDFQGSLAYWEARYVSGGNSGTGSYGKLAQFKAEVINAFVAEKGIHSVVEFGCGDGNQLTLARYPSYTGFDVSATAINRCREMFAVDQRKTFHLVHDYRGQVAELVLSLDVIYHLVEDDVFEKYMQMLFGASRRFVIIYASDVDESRGQSAAHVRHRKFSRWVHDCRPDFQLVEHVPNRYPYRTDYREGSFSDLFIYEKL